MFLKYFIKVSIFLGLATVLTVLTTCSALEQDSEGELQGAVSLPRALAFQQTGSSQSGSSGTSTAEQEFLNNVWTGNMINILEYTHIPDTPTLWDDAIYTFTDNNHADPYNGRYRSSSTAPDYTNGKFYRELTHASGANSGDLVEMGYMAWNFGIDSSINNIESISLYMHGFINGNIFEQKLSATAADSVYYTRYSMDEGNHRYLTYSKSTPTSLTSNTDNVELYRNPPVADVNSGTVITSNDYEILFVINRNYTNGASTEYTRSELVLKYTSQSGAWSRYYNCYSPTADADDANCFKDSAISTANEQELTTLLGRTADLASIVTAFNKIDRNFIVAKRPTINPMPAATTLTHPTADFDGLLQKLLADTQ